MLADLGSVTLGLRKSAHCRRGERKLICTLIQAKLESKMPSLYVSDHQSLDPSIQVNLDYWFQLYDLEYIL